MKRYANRASFGHATYISSLEHGFPQKIVDEHCIQALNERRIAVSFAAALLSAVVETAEIMERETAFQEKIRAVIAECQNVLGDNSVYILDDSEDPENSKFLEEACEKALKAAAHAGNLCNNLVIFFSKSPNTEKLLFQARKMCDSATKKVFGSC